MTNTFEFADSASLVCPSFAPAQKYYLPSDALNRFKHMNTVTGGNPRRSRSRSRSDAFITHLLERAEKERAQLVKLLHDDLGGLMVAAAIDIAWAEEHSPELSVAAREKLRRSRDAVRSAIDLKRQLIEELRPTLLDNFGLFAALRWHIKHTRRRDTAFKETYHHPEPKFTSEASTALFRIAQTALSIIGEHAIDTGGSLSVTLDDDHVRLRVTDEAPASDAERQKASDSDAFLAITHRVRALGGKLRMIRSSSGGTTICATIPKARALAGVA